MDFFLATNETGVEAEFVKNKVKKYNLKQVLELFSCWPDTKILFQQILLSLHYPHYKFSYRYFWQVKYKFV